MTSLLYIVEVGQNIEREIYRRPGSWDTIINMLVPSIDI